MKGIIRGRHHVCGLLLSAFFVSVSGVALAGAGEDAQKFIVDFTQETLKSFSPDESEASVEKKFDAYYKAHFDNESIARFVLGRSWNKASDAEKAEFTSLFEKYIVRVYSGRFRSYSGEVKVSSFQDIGNNLYIVNSSFLAQSGEDKGKPVLVDWRVGHDGSSYKIYDITVAGVSLSVTQRSEIASILRNNGGQVSALLDVLRKKVN
ncbi:MAG: ABC transporter substrate-binding protein [Alphaproteobacteria bacterium GM7ARS4]|nr:ABC transporter substrate-binding protein [Alphaproteobacteria bacterium GM7ARS4]